MTKHTHESKAAYLALFSRLPAPDVLITDGLRGAEAACTQAWPGTRIQRCLVHVQRNTRTDLTSRPRLQAGRELKRLSDRLTSVETAGQAVRWGEALNAWHERWKDFIAERTYARDDPSNPKASRHRWWWTHEELRRCHRRLERLFREGRLFAYLEPELLKGGPVARTTNRLEGGVNSVVKDVCLCSISCCGFSHDDFSGLGRACRPRNGLNWMVLVSPPERTGKDYDQHAPSTVYPSFAAERGIRRVDRAENTCQRADGA